MLPDLESMFWALLCNSVTRLGLGFKVRVRVSVRISVMVRVSVRVSVRLG